MAVGYPGDAGSYDHWRDADRVGHGSGQGGGAVSDLHENADNCISSQLSAILDQLTTEQIRFVIARQDYTTDKEAADAVGISTSSVYRWPSIVKEAVALMAQDGLVTALHLRRRNLAKAMLRKVGALDSGDEKIAQSAATEIIEWEMGKAVQKQEITGKDGKDLIQLKWPEETD